MKVRIIRSTGSWYDCHNEQKELIRARIKGKFRVKGFNTTNPVAVGDWVELQKEAGLETAIIHQIHERKNYIIRKAPRNPHKHHIIASNMDQLFLIASLKLPRTSLGFIDRMLMIAEMQHIPATIIINKKDIYKEKELKKYEEIKATYESIGKSAYPIHLLSALNPEDLKGLHQMIEGKTTLFVGHSGVGKSSLINGLIPGLGLNTKDISRLTSKGVHTTTYSELYPLPGEGYIVDTPGIKELEAVDIEPEEISHYFPEMRDRLNDCKFNNCLHRDEPKCAIKKGFEEGEIAESRFINYLNILADTEATNYWER